MQKNAKKTLSVIRIVVIVVLGSYSGMMANRFFTQESQGYNKRAAYVERQQIEKEANFKSEHLKKSNKKERVKQKIEVFPVVIVPRITSAYTDNAVADDLKVFKVPDTVSDIIASFIGHPYIALPGGT